MTAWAAGLVAALLFAGRAALAGPLPEEAWTDPSADLGRVLTEARAECLSLPDDPDLAYLVEVGRAAFRDPLLLGGLAARKDLSCESCHRGGHDNPHLFIQGISGAPGTADVTTSIYSKTRGDRVHNPVVIPDLHGVRGKARFGTMAPAPSLEAFIRSAIVEEFQGARPPKAVLAGLVAYVERLDPAACGHRPATHPLTEQDALGDIRRALWAASAAHERGDGAVAGFLAAAARKSLGRLHARYDVDGLDGPAGRLTSLARDLAPLRAGLELGDDGAARGLDDVFVRLDALAPVLAAARPRSLFDPDTLSHRLDTD